MQLHLQSYGARLRTKDGLFHLLVYNKKDMLVKKLFAVAEVESIWLNAGSSVSVDAILLALQHNVDIHFLDKQSYPIGRINTYKPNSTTKIQKAQLWASQNEIGIQLAVQWGIHKMTNQRDLLDALGIKYNNTAAIGDLLDQIEQMIHRLEQLNLMEQNEIASTIRGLEGTGSRAYFRGISTLLPPIFRFEKRSRMPAKDPFNATLNYCYALLYARVEKALVLAGLNPYIGFLHRDGYQYKSLVFDFIEPYRQAVDKMVFLMCQEGKLKDTDFQLSKEGCALNKGGKQKAIKAFIQLAEKKIKWTLKTAPHKLDNILLNNARKTADYLVQEFQKFKDDLPC